MYVVKVRIILTSPLSRISQTRFRHSVQAQFETWEVLVTKFTLARRALPKLEFPTPHRLREKQPNVSILLKLPDFALLPIVEPCNFGSRQIVCLNGKPPLFISWSHVSSNFSVTWHITLYVSQKSVWGTSLIFWESQRILSQDPRPDIDESRNRFWAHVSVCNTPVFVAHSWFKLYWFTFVDDRNIFSSKSYQASGLDVKSTSFQNTCNTFLKLHRKTKHAHQKHTEEPERKKKISLILIF